MFIINFYVVNMALTAFHNKNPVYFNIRQSNISFYYKSWVFWDFNFPFNFRFNFS